MILCYFANSQRMCLGALTIDAENPCQIFADGQC